MPGTTVRFRTPFQNYNPATIFEVDQAGRSLRPFGSGSAFQEAGYQFGQEREVANLNEFAGFSVGPVINDRAANLAAVKNELNAYQNQTFNAEQPTPKRKSSTLAESIAKANQDLDDGLAEFQKLRKQLETLKTPNYTDEFNKLRTEQGVPGLEQDFVNVRKTRRELPYTERAASGNAGVMTEGQLGANVAQKDIPLEAQEANLLDRLKLAESFINNSLKLKELDFNTSKQGILDAISLVAETINLSRSQLADLKADRKDEQARQDAALEFALNNNINTPVFVVGTQGYNSRTLEPISLEQYQELTGQQVGLPEAQTDFGPTKVTRIDAGKQEERALVLDLMAKYPDAGIARNDSFIVASSKLKNSRIYQEQVRRPSSSGTGYTETKDKEQQAVIDSAAAQFASSKGQDGYVSPELYRDFKRQYINKGGSANDFLAALPIEQYIAPGNQKGDLAQSSGARDVNKEARLQQLLQKSNNGSNLDALSPEEQIELYSLL